MVQRQISGCASPFFGHLDDRSILNALFCCRLCCCYTRGIERSTTQVHTCVNHVLIFVLVLVFIRSWCQTAFVLERSLCTFSTRGRVVLVEASEAHPAHGNKSSHTHNVLIMEQHIYFICAIHLFCVFYILVRWNFHCDCFKLRAVHIVPKTDFGVFYSKNVWIKKKRCGNLRAGSQIFQFE